MPPVLLQSGAGSVPVPPSPPPCIPLRSPLAALAADVPPDTDPTTVPNFALRLERCGLCEKVSEPGPAC